MDILLDSITIVDWQSSSNGVCSLKIQNVTNRNKHLAKKVSFLTCSSGVAVQHSGLSSELDGTFC